jgi:hypothetical protein
MPNVEEARAAQRGARSATKGLPGMWMALVIAGLSTLGIGYWAQAGKAAPGERAAADGIRVAEVAPKDIPAALETIDAPPEQLARFKTREACNTRLAWLTIVRGPGQPDGRIRLQSGHYFSPVFPLTDVPLRVALPYPAPYVTGRGTISVLGTTSDAILALTPPWHVPAQAGVRAQEVTWTPVAACPAATR